MQGANKKFVWAPRPLYLGSVWVGLGGGAVTATPRHVAGLNGVVADGVGVFFYGCLPWWAQVYDFEKRLTGWGVLVLLALDFLSGFSCSERGEKRFE